jgi:hypothetical protein
VEFVSYLCRHLPHLPLKLRHPLPLPHYSQYVPSRAEPPSTTPPVRFTPPSSTPSFPPPPLPLHSRRAPSRAEPPFTKPPAPLTPCCRLPLLGSRLLTKFPSTAGSLQHHDAPSSPFILSSSSPSSPLQASPSAALPLWPSCRSPQLFSVEKGLTMKGRDEYVRLGLLWTCCGEMEG